MNEYIIKVKNFIEKKKLLDAGDHVLIGLSGGADSVCLLRILLELREEYNLTLHALHLEHGIRGEESKRDADFSKIICERFGVDFKMVNVDVPKLAKERKLSLEEAGRAARYEAFYDRCKEIQKEEQCSIKLSVAHHGNDNAETLFFNLTRGSGIKGACGIKPVVEGADGICIIRPLLCLKRTEIEDILEEYKQNYCVDVTNLSTDYTRNKIRHTIVPKLEEINDRAVEHIFAFTDEMRGIKDYLDCEVKKCVDEAVVFSDGCADVSISKLRGKHEVLIDMTLKYVLVRVCGFEKDLNKQHIAQIKELMVLQSGRQINLPYGVLVRREYERLFFITTDKMIDSHKEGTNYVPKIHEMFNIRHFSLEKEALQSLEIPKKTYTKWFDYDKIDGGLFIRCWQRTDRIVIDKNGHTKGILDYLKDEKVPASERKKVLVLCDSKDVIWVIGHRISEKYRITSDTQNVVELECKL